MMLRSLPTDWSVHTHSEAWPLSRGKVFLAEAIRRFGRIVFDYWDGREPAWADHSRLPDVPHEDDAFDGNQPRQTVHDLFGPAVRKIMSPGQFLARHLEASDDATYIQSLVLDPQSKHPVPAPLLRAISGEDGSDPISYDHWSAVFWESMNQNDELDGAQKRLPTVAASFLRLVQSSKLRTFARPIHGGDSVALELSLWEVDSALPRIASCGLNLDVPMNPSAMLTHWIFVDEQDLEREMRLAKSENQPSDQRGGPISYAQPTKDACAAWLQSQFKELSTGSWTKADFSEKAVQKFGRSLSARGFQEAWAAAAKDYPDRRRAGRRAANS